MTQFYLALLAILFIQTVLLALSAPSGDITDDQIPHPAMSCDEGNSTCPDGFCCVKKVITYADVRKFAAAFMECQQLRKEHQFCLVNTENYMCPCKKGFFCKSEDKENFGTCESVD